MHRGVLLFGTGNRYSRAVDGVHWLFEAVEKGPQLEEHELRLRVRQLEASKTRALLIVRALTCFYAAVAGFAANTLVSLIGAVLVYMAMHRAVTFSFVLAFLAGTLAVFAMISGALMLARESRFSFRVLREEKNFITEHVHERVARLTQTPV